jgi:hypothetical protein
VLASFEKEAARWPGGILSCKPNDGVSSLFDGAISGVIVEVRLRVAGIGGVHIDDVLCKVLGQGQAKRIQRRPRAVVSQNIDGMVGVCGLGKPCQGSQTAANHDDFGLTGSPKQGQKRLRYPDRAEDIGLVYGFDLDQDFVRPARHNRLECRHC